jgi:hypothetical protein
MQCVHHVQLTERDFTVTVNDMHIGQILRSRMYLASSFFIAPCRAYSSIWIYSVGSAPYFNSSSTRCSEPRLVLNTIMRGEHPFLSTILSLYCPLQRWFCWDGFQALHHQGYKAFVPSRRQCLGLRHLNILPMIQGSQSRAAFSTSRLSRWVAAVWSFFNHLMSCHLFRL